MEKRNPSRAEVAKALADGPQALSKLHTEWAKSKGTPAELARSQIDRLLDHKRLERESSWDAAEQTFLSLYALNQVAQDAELQARLARVLPMRAFQPGHNSPRSDPKLGFLPDEVFKTLSGK